MVGKNKDKIFGDWVGSFFVFAPNFFEPFLFSRFNFFSGTRCGALCTRKSFLQPAAISILVSWSVVYWSVAYIVNMTGLECGSSTEGLNASLDKAFPQPHSYSSYWTCEFDRNVSGVHCRGIG